MEIGGYFELEHFNSRPYYSGLYELNLGRTALIYLLQSLKCRTLHVPYFICDSVTSACERAGFSLQYYHLDRNLAPVLECEPVNDEYLYLINYYGQLSDEQILAFSQRYERIIVDNTQSFFQRPLKNIPTLYSCRKYFGVSDGAYLSCSLTLPPLSETDQSQHRMAHLLGRFEDTASEHYSEMLASADSFHREPIKNMSLITGNILNGIDYDAVRRTRSRNYRYLSERLEQENIMNHIVPDGPFAYPFYTRNGPAIRKELASLHIYIPTYWNNVIATMPEESVEYDLAANILPLPCDQRYGNWEMEHLADAVLTVMQQFGE
ncbi:hypothetical protein MCG98_06410 [Ruminococcus sp. OA3]|uniref:hypothetical protein n=1 Tax=Ruminococcus sp. OA3 TaxID=2914164 RepID=UPI001F064A0C|nr:hypothetical protein [Ruminococcus sp. OA3]MCH1982197.1 hypothetical protein [Ruminococcus sp. OA3]